jgi:hypothetical protein
MKVFLDDERLTPEGWWRVYDPAQTIAILEMGMVTHLSLDHDLGDDKEIGTGYDVVLWIEEQVATNGFNPPHILVHSANPSARLKMESGIRQIRKIYDGIRESSSRV